MPNPRGIEGEEEAVKHLLKRGYKIIKRNFQARGAEIDIIASIGETLVFVEVKSVRHDSKCHPLENVHPAKQRKIQEAALIYLSNLPSVPAARFDVISVFFNLSPKVAPRIEHLPGAFDLQ